MINHRKLLAGAAFASTAGVGVALGYAGRGEISAILNRLTPGRVPPPGAALAGAEFMGGETELVGDLLLARSEARWLREHHATVTEPSAILALLSRG